MNTSKQHPDSPDENATHVGLVANGRAENWEVSVDETISGADRWYVQIEGPSVYLYFEIPSPSTIEELFKFLESPEALSIERRMELEVGIFNETQVMLLRDDEFPDRCFFCISEEGRASIRISVVGDDLKALSTATCQVLDELRSGGY